MKTNIFIQIGLCTELEYHYLALPYPENIKKALMFSEAENRVEFVVPFRVWNRCGFDPMHVVGVDMNPESIKFVEGEYLDNPNITLLNTAIWNKEGQMKHNSWDIRGIYKREVNPEFWKEAITPCITLKTLFEDVLKSVPDGQIWGLAIDVEGAEYDILSAYDWEIKPNYIVVEHHGPENYDKVFFLLAKQGYLVHTRKNACAKYTRHI